MEFTGDDADDADVAAASASRFDDIISQLPPTRQVRIQNALTASDTADTADLEAVIRGRDIDGATVFLEGVFNLSRLDASALAGVLLAPSEGERSPLLLAQ